MNNFTLQYSQFPTRTHRENLNKPHHHNNSKNQQYPKKSFNNNLLPASITAQSSSQCLKMQKTKNEKKKKERCARKVPLRRVSLYSIFALLSSKETNSSNAA
jgi:hypothetical protein